VGDVDPRVAAELSSKAPDVVQLAREALSNVERHAEATTTRVSLSLSDGAGVLEIDDDGRGFDPEAVRGAGGNSLPNLEERAASLGGRLDVESRPLEGTLIRLVLPLE
jgi:two-component system sensor histidine kinase DegS